MHFTQPAPVRSFQARSRSNVEVMAQGEMSSKAPFAKSPSPLPTLSLNQFSAFHNVYVQFLSTPTNRFTNSPRHSCFPSLRLPSGQFQHFKLTVTSQSEVHRRTFTLKNGEGKVTHETHGDRNDASEFNGEQNPVSDNKTLAKEIKQEDHHARSSFATSTPLAVSDTLLSSDPGPLCSSKSTYHLAPQGLRFIEHSLSLVISRSAPYSCKPIHPLIGAHVNVADFFTFSLDKNTDRISTGTEFPISTIARCSIVVFSIGESTRRNAYL